VPRPCRPLPGARRRRRLSPHRHPFRRKGSLVQLSVVQVQLDHSCVDLDAQSPPAVTRCGRDLLEQRPALRFERLPPDIGSEVSQAETTGAEAIVADQLVESAFRIAAASAAGQVEREPGQRPGAVLGLARSVHAGLDLETFSPSRSADRLTGREPATFVPQHAGVAIARGARHSPSGRGPRRPRTSGDRSSRARSRHLPSCPETPRRPAPQLGPPERVRARACARLRTLALRWCLEGRDVVARQQGERGPARQVFPAGLGTPRLEISRGGDGDRSRRDRARSRDAGSDCGVRRGRGARHSARVWPGRT
jgi:hypothetical protein